MCKFRFLSFLGSRRLGIAFHLGESAPLAADLAIDGFPGIRPGAVLTGNVEAGWGLEGGVLLFWFHGLVG